ncbi:MAG: multiprotein bridging factor aMBF1 [Candidatus Micrarchaeaceae archaeon]
MEECELCGSQMSSPYVVLVEGVELRVCAKCARGKKVVSHAQQQSTSSGKPQRQSKPHQAAKEEDMDIIEGYGEVIKAAREAMNIPIKVLGEMINEKDTLLLRIEEQKTIPNIRLAKKLERALNIKLLEQPEAESPQGQTGGKRNFSIGDIVG